MNKLDNLPKIFAKYEAEVEYQNKREEQEIIEFIADRISTLFSNCLKQKYQEQMRRRPDGYVFQLDYLPDDYPEKGQRIQFKEHLKNALKEHLSGELKNPNVITARGLTIVKLEVDNGPAKLLYDTLEKSQIYFECRAYRFFPVKKTVSISCNRQRNIISINIPGP